MEYRSIEHYIVAAAIVVVAGLALMFDVLMPLGVAGGIPYVIIVVLGLRLRNPYWIFGLAGVSTLLTAVGYFASEPLGVHWMVLTNRALALLIIWTCAVLVFNLRFELRKAVKNLETQKHVLDHHAIVTTTDEDGTITYANSKFCEISKYEIEELVGQNQRVIKSGHHSREFYEQMWRTISSGNVWHGEICNRSKDGTQYWVDSTIAPLFDEQGKIDQYTAVQTDITDRKRTEEQLRRSQKLEAMGELSGGIAHDFNNLLGIIVGNLDLMSIKIEDGSKLQEQLEKAQKAALRGSELTRRLLNFSRQSPEAHSPVDANKVIRNLEELISKSLTTSISVEMVLADDLWMVELDPGVFEDAIINLSLNARDAMPNGGALIFETNNITLDRAIADRTAGIGPGEYVEFTVTDTGTGMPKEVSDRIFDPFFTTKEKGRGTGLGLAMVYGFVQRSKGHILVHSKEGVGTTFKIYLPRSLSVAKRKEYPAEERELPPRGTETILVVDDEKELAETAKRMLEELGYSTICAYSGEKALQVLEGNDTIDLLFSDIVMPGPLGGFDLAEAAIIVRPGLKILLTSGFRGDAKRSGASEKWARGMLKKPYGYLALAKRVRATLDEEN